MIDFIFVNTLVSGTHIRSSSPINYASFDTFAAKIGRLFSSQSVFKVSSEIEFLAK